MATQSMYVEGQDLHMVQVKAFLDKRAETDAVFAIKYQTSGKTMKGCMTHLYKEGMKFIVMKKAQMNGRTCDVADVPNEIAHQQAVDYFMNDALNEEPKTAEPSALSALSAMTVKAPATQVEKNAQEVLKAEVKKIEKKPAKKDAKKPEKKTAPIEDALDFDWFD